MCEKPYCSIEINDSYIILCKEEDLDCVDIQELIIRLFPESYLSQKSFFIRFLFFLSFLLKIRFLVFDYKISRFCTSQFPELDHIFEDLENKNKKGVYFFALRIFEKNGEKQCLGTPYNATLLIKPGPP